MIDNQGVTGQKTTLPTEFDVSRSTQIVAKGEHRAPLGTLAIGEMNMVSTDAGERIGTIHAEEAAISAPGVGPKLIARRLEITRKLDEIDGRAGDGKINNPFAAKFGYGGAADMLNGGGARQAGSKAEAFLLEQVRKQRRRGFEHVLAHQQLRRMINGAWARQGHP